MIIDDLITRYAAKDEFFTVTLPDGEELKFRHLRDYAEIKKVQEEAAKFASDMMKEEKAKLPAFRDIYTDNVDTLTSVAVLASTIEEPKISNLELLKLAKKAGLLFQFIVNQYNIKETQHIVRQDLEKVDDLKND